MCAKESLTILQNDLGIFCCDSSVENPWSMGCGGQSKTRVAFLSDLSSSAGTEALILDALCRVRRRVQLRLGSIFSVSPILVNYFHSRK